MDYKKIFKNRDMRLKILELFNWISDKKMIELQYRIKTGRKLDLNNPTRYTEKLQWYKLYYKDPLMAYCSDKYSARQYVKKRGLGDILNDIYCIYDDINEIDFNNLPNEFVLKKTNGGGGNDIIICKDKSKLDINKTRERMSNWTKKKNNGGGREWVYYKEKPKIIAEKFICDDDLTDYKFFCFNGEPYCLYVINGRKLGEEINLGIFDLKFNQLPYFRGDENPMKRAPNKPDNFEQMIEVSKRLSEDFPHVRVDLYNVKGKIIFGELTFFDGSGYQSYIPDVFDFILGEKFELPKVRK